MNKLASIYDETAAKELAHKTWQGAKALTHPTLLNYTAHYMSYVHYLLVFVNDMLKGVIPNDRVTAVDKFAYVAEFMDYAYAEGSVFEESIDTPEDFPVKLLYILRDKETTRGTPAYCYNQLSGSHDTTITVLGKCMLIHSHMRSIYKYFVEDLADQPKHKAYAWAAERIEKQFSGTVK